MVYDNREVCHPPFVKGGDEEACYGRNPARGIHPTGKENKTSKAVGKKPMLFCFTF